MTLLEAGSICDIIKQASENRPNKSRRTCGSKAVAMRTCKKFWKLSIPPLLKSL